VVTGKMGEKDSEMGEKDSREDFRFELFGDDNTHKISFRNLARRRTPLNPYQDCGLRALSTGRRNRYLILPSSSYMHSFGDTGPDIFHG
jgi:hypothetical protein